MSVDRYLKDEGIVLEPDNSLPKKVKGEDGQNENGRTQKTVKRVIAAVRAAEADFNDALREANQRCNAAQAELVVVMRKLAKSEAECAKLKMERTLQLPEYGSLSEPSKERLVGSSVGQLALAAG